MKCRFSTPSPCPLTEQPRIKNRFLISFSQAHHDFLTSRRLWFCSSWAVVFLASGMRSLRLLRVRVAARIEIPAAERANDGEDGSRGGAGMALGLVAHASVSWRSIR